LAVFISFSLIHPFVTRAYLNQISFTKQDSNESEINGPGKKKLKVLRQQSTEKYLLRSYRTWIPECLIHVGKTFGRITILPFTLKVEIVTVEFAAYLTNVYTGEGRPSLFYDQKSMYSSSKYIWLKCSSVLCV
jgi:hypothetical protein